MKGVYNFPQTHVCRKCGAGFLTDHPRNYICPECKKPAPKPCLQCGRPTGKTNRAKYCAECAYAIKKNIIRNYYYENKEHILRKTAERTRRQREMYEAGLEHYRKEKERQKTDNGYVEGVSARTIQDANPSKMEELIKQMATGKLRLTAIR